MRSILVAQYEEQKEKSYRAMMFFVLFLGLACVSDSGAGKIAMAFASGVAFRKLTGCLAGVKITFEILRLTGHTDERGKEDGEGGNGA